MTTDTFLAALAAAGLGFVSFDETGAIVASNPTFCDLVERSASELESLSYWDITAPGQKQREINELMQPGGSAYDKEFVTLGGATISVSAQGGSILVDGKQRFHVMARPIAKRDDVDVQRALRQQNAILLDLARAEAIDAGELDAALKLITEAATAGLNCARSSVWLYGEADTKIVCLDLFQIADDSHADGVELFAKDFPGYFDALREDRTIAANDAHHHPATREFSEVYLAPLGITSMLEAPIRQKGKLIGVLCNEHIGPMRAFSQEEQNFAAAVADMVTRALDAHERREAEQELQKANDALARHAAELEATVARRTRDITMMLDATGDGFLACALDGTLRGQTSRATRAWFGTPSLGESVWDYLFDGAAIRGAFADAFSQFADDFLPFELLADQMPSEFARDGKRFEVEYAEIRDGEALTGLSLVVRDVSADYQAREQRRAAEELQSIIGNILRDRDGFASFVDECEALFRKLEHDDARIAKRALHTIKGNTAIYGMIAFSDRCHDLESEIEAADRGPNANEVGTLEAAWREELDRVAAYVTFEREEGVFVHDDELERFSDLAARGTRPEALAAMIAAWRRPTTARLLQRLGDQATRLSQRFGKKIEVEITDGGLRAPEGELSSFWSGLVHIVRNAVDHGLETTPQRQAAGKPTTGKIKLETYVGGDGFVVAVEDDGRGVDWDRVRTQALARGLAADTRADLERALFADGLSTAAEVSDISGRGVGLAAVVEATEKAGGAVNIITQPDRGTRFEFVFPRLRLAA